LRRVRETSFSLTAVLISVFSFAKLCAFSLPAYNVVLSDQLPEGFLHQLGNSTLQEWNLGDLELNEEVITTYQVLVEQAAAHGKHINVATVKADNHSPVTDDAVIGIGGVDPPIVPPIIELPETGVSFLHIVVWVNLLLLTLLLSVEVASFMATGEMVFPRSLTFLKSGETKLFAAAGVGTMGVVILLGVLLYPFVPMMAYSTPEKALVSEAAWAEALQADEQKLSVTQETAPMQGNYLIIPKIGVRVPIAEGPDASSLKKGAWLLPGTSNPTKGSNMALAAHRFRWNPPYEHTFYHLDKLQEGDLVQVFWQGKEYRYQMVSSQVVAPDAMEVLNSTEKSTVTLITCNPIFSVAERLVVKAELVEVV